MPRKKRVCPDLNAFHIYARSNNRISFGINQEVLWSIFCNYLFFIHHGYGVKIHCFSLMKNHFHLLCSFPKLNLSESMLYFMREVSRAINNERESINHIFGGRFKSTLIVDPHHYAITYKYVLQNPLRAKLSSNLWAYPYTTVSECYGYQKGIIPVSRHCLGLDELIPEQFEDYFSWIHDEYTEGDVQRIQSALVKKNFKFPKDEASRKFLKVEL